MHKSIVVILFTNLNIYGDFWVTGWVFLLDQLMGKKENQSDTPSTIAV